MKNFQKNKRKILVVVAHPDDEVFGCAGTIARHIKNNDKVFCMYLTDGVKAKYKNAEKNFRIRKNNLLKVERLLKFKWLHEFSGKFIDQKLDTVSLTKISKEIELAKNKVNPDIIYTHSFSDLNKDHRLVVEATLVAFRPKPENKFTSILSFEVPSATDFGGSSIKKNFSPNYFVNIKKFWKIKKKAMKIYGRETLKYPNSRSLKGVEVLNNLRGIQNGIEIAEAFEIIKTIKR